jgi:hypothetical protein
MAPQRKLDVVVDSVKRLLRIGATGNLLNLLQKQHPADVAQILSTLQERERQAAFSILVERNSRLAMEALSELGPEAGSSGRKPARRCSPTGRPKRSPDSSRSCRPTTRPR